MRCDESQYWDKQASAKLKTYMDNIWKRQQIVRRLLESEIIGHQILEIGVGIPFTIQSIRYALGSFFKYVCTDVSQKYVDFARSWKLEAVHTDATKLPGSSYTRIIALDSLEHVRPDDRPAAWKEIGRVMGGSCKVFLNIPVDETHHDLEFDYPFNIRDVCDLADATRTRIVRWEPYTANGVHPDGYKVETHHIWGELER